MSEKPGFQNGNVLLHRLYPDLHLSFPVERNQELRAHNGLPISQLPAVKIGHLMDRLDSAEPLNQAHNEFHAEISTFFQNRLIHEKLLEPYQLYETVSWQRESLEHWIDFLLTPNHLDIPAWARYWMFRGAIKLIVFGPLAIIKRRRRKTRQPFIERVDTVLAELWKNMLNDFSPAIGADGVPGFKQSNWNFTFADSYWILLTRWKSSQLSSDSITNGKWIHYDSNEFTYLCRDIYGTCSGWCVSSRVHASQTCHDRETYVFFSTSNGTEFRIPRALLTVSENVVEGVYGILPGQEIEPCMEQEVSKKINGIERGAIPDYPGQGLLWE